MAANKPSSREQVKQIVAGIERGIQDLFQSEKFADYLRTMSRFHSYSYNNTILIHMQMPSATQVAGFNKWKNQFGRHVKKGEKGLTIIAPTPFKKKIEEMKLDPDTKAPVLDQDGNAIIEEKVIEIPLFRPVKVFDVSQTEGKPLPSLASDLTGDVQQYEAFMEALRRASPVPMEIKPIEESMDGFFSNATQSITIRAGMSQVQTVCAAVHEIAHSILHNREQTRLTATAGDGTKEPLQPKDKNTMEVEAESVSYAVCQYFGIETGANSLGYIATWSKDRSLPELKASLETITKTVNGLINDIDRHFAEVCKERGIDLTAQQAEQAEPPAPEQQEAPVAGQPEQDGKRYVYKMEANPNTVGAIDRHFIQAYIQTGKITLIPEQILFIGRSEVCADLLGLLNSGALGHDDFFTVSAARVSHYATRDGADLDAFVGPDDKVYIGRRDHYDNRGHYINKDKSLLYLSDNVKMFDLISGSSFPDTQADLLAEGCFTQEDYAEFAALQAGALAQLEQTQPLLFAGEPFSLIPQDTPEPEQKDMQDTTLDEYPMPDPQMPKSGLLAYGYEEDDLIPVGPDVAKDLFARDFSLYAAGSSGYFNMVFEREELDGSDIRLYAIPRGEWEASPNFRQAVMDRMNHQNEREAAFLNHTGDCFAVYQVRDDPALRDIRFESLDWLKSISRTVERQNYDLVYTAPLPAVDSVDAALDQLWYQFNNDCPADYQHPSMSVSDIIAVKREGMVSFHYCDSFGFQQLPDFIQPKNYLKNAEMAMEDDYGMIDGIINNGPKEGSTVAELEAQVKAGQQISLMDLAGAVQRERQGKHQKSVLGQLRNQPKQEQRKSMPKKSAEKER